MIKVSRENKRYSFDIKRMYGMYEIIDVRRRKETPKKPQNSKKYYK